MGTQEKEMDHLQIRQESGDPIGHSKQASVTASSNGLFDESSNLIGHKSFIWMCLYLIGSTFHNGQALVASQIKRFECLHSWSYNGLIDTGP